MSVLALFAKGKTKLVDIHHARAKESDRISDLRKELLKVGAMSLKPRML
jgi:5-enolpyruvylshikimate-3-phosphate synthase